MLISQPALLCLEATWKRMLGRAEKPDQQHVPFLPRDSEADREPAPLCHDADSGPRSAALTAPPDRHDAPGPALRQPESPLTPNERRARAAALRALALSRGRRFDAARAAFAEAARLDPALDLTRTPDFWKLERAAHDAAIEAYVDVGRDNDATVLRARVWSTFRPKPLKPQAGPVLAP